MQQNAVPTEPTTRQDAANAGASANSVLHERSRHHFWQGAGALSVKAFFAGQARYSVGAARFVVDTSNYLVLNDEQPYTVEIDAAEPVESFCIFFAPGFAEQVQRDLAASEGQLLDDLDTNGEPVSFF